jgi:hypothetical protein
VTNANKNVLQRKFLISIRVPVLKEMVEEVMLSNVAPAEAARTGKLGIDDILRQ